MRVSGTNLVASDAIKLGAHHTIQLELNKQFTIYKDEWDSVVLDRIDQACNPERTAEVAALVLNEGTANLCLITENMTIVKAHISTSIPRKKISSSQHDKSMTRFFESCMDAVLRNINFSNVKCVIVASPAFVKDQFLEYLFAEALKRNLRDITKNKSIFLPIHCSSGHKMSLREILEDPAVKDKLSDTKAAREVRLLQEFFNLMRTDGDRITYGVKHVQKAMEIQAIRTLLITDALFRSTNLATRKMYVGIVDQLRESGVEVSYFSSLHVSGQRLFLFSSISFSSFF